VSRFARPLAAVLLFALVAGGQDKPAAVKTTKAQRDKLLAADADRRAGFAKARPKALPEAKRKLPDATAPAFDWVPVLGLTPLHAQGGKPSCVAQATVAALEWNWQLRNGGPTKPVLSPQPTLDRLRPTGGLKYVDALNDLLARGTAPLADYPYTGDPQAPPKGAATRFRLVGWGRVGSGKGPPTVEEVKEALLEHGPLVVGVRTTPAFHRYKGGVFAEHAKPAPGEDPTNHAVVIIGWDDRKGKGCWHVQNSWGLKWGDGGGMWIEYGCNNVAYLAYWVRAQSSQYALPADAHELLGGDADPFPRWPGAKDPPAGGKK
jgi:cathepsin L